MTVLVVIVAVFLAYNANRGLPFVPTRELKVDIGDGSNLVAGNDVLEGGHRVGFVSELKPVGLGNGSTGAQLTLKLSKNQGSVPVDSTVTVRLRSVLGSKYVDLVKGSSSRSFADGATMPISQTNVPVQLDQVFDMFNPPTRTAVQGNLVGFGDTFAARGGDLSSTIQSLPALLGYLTPVASYLSDPSTGLVRFLDSLGFVYGGGVAGVWDVGGFVQGFGDDVWGHCCESGEFGGDDREVAVDFVGVDGVVEGAGAVPRGSDAVWWVFDAGHGVVEGGVAEYQRVA